MQLIMTVSITFYAVPKNSEYMLETSDVSEMSVNDNSVFTNEEDKKHKVKVYAVNNGRNILVEKVNRIYDVM